MLSRAGTRGRRGTWRSRAGGCRGGHGAGRYRTGRVAVARRRKWQACCRWPDESRRQSPRGSGRRPAARSRAGTPAACVRPRQDRVQLTDNRPVAASAAKATSWPARATVTGAPTLAAMPGRADLDLLRDVGLLSGAQRRHLPNRSRMRPRPGCMPSTRSRACESWSRHDAAGWSARSGQRPDRCQTRPTPAALPSSSSEPASSQRMVPGPSGVSQDSGIHSSALA